MTGWQRNIGHIIPACAGMTALMLTLLSLLFSAVPLNAQMTDQGFREEFNTLDKWKPQTFPKILPHSSLNYIWANKKYPESILPNTYTAKTQMILLQKGPERVGQWIEEKVNALEDYRKAFGMDPPTEASLAIMSDADNTGEKAVGYIDYIEVSAQ